MIVPKSASLARMLQYVGLPLLGLIAWDVIIVLAYKMLHWEWVGSRNVPLALYGSAIGIIVGFRNNSAYGRWWEARTLWGSIVNNSRSLARPGLHHPRRLRGRPWTGRSRGPCHLPWPHLPPDRLRSRSAATAARARPCR